jgi:hypothetical protein
MLMTDSLPTTKPKPFVFVLMPFANKFDDIYKLGIKGAAAEAGTYAERVDEQTFAEGMLDRVFNQINKADVIVADMTGKNPNVFYEVGYAHALDKIVLLVTQKADDIPFDLKHRQHIVYGRSIDKLKSELVAKIRWAIEEAKRRSEGLIAAPSISVQFGESDLVRDCAAENAAQITIAAWEHESVSIVVTNESERTLEPISHVYLFSAPGGAVVPVARRDKSAAELTRERAENITATHHGSTMRFPLCEYVPIETFTVKKSDCVDGLLLQSRLPIKFGPIPPGAAETAQIFFEVDRKSVLAQDGFVLSRSVPFAERSVVARSTHRLRIHVGRAIHDFRFQLRIPQ